MGAGEEEWNHIRPIMEVELGPFFIHHQEYQLSFSSTMNPPAILGMLYFQKLHQQPLGGVIIAFHLLADLTNLMIGWQMCKRASKESHKLQSCACSHCAWNTVCIVYTYDIGINCPSGGIGFEHWTGETYFYIHCQLDTCQLPNCHCHLWKLWKCKCIDLSGFMQDIQLTTGTTIATVSSRMCLLAAQYLCKVGIFSSP